MMQLDQFLHKRKSDARSFMLTRLRSVDLVEAVEDFVELIWWDADAGVGDGDFDKPSRVTLSAARLLFERDEVEGCRQSGAEHPSTPLAQTLAALRMTFN